jgi:hypothetical protein
MRSVWTVRSALGVSYMPGERIRATRWPRLSSAHNIICCRELRQKIVRVIKDEQRPRYVRRPTGDEAKIAAERIALLRVNVLAVVQPGGLEGATELGPDRQLAATRHPQAVERRSHAVTLHQLPTVMEIGRIVKRPRQLLSPVAYRRLTRVDIPAAWERIDTLFAACGGRWQQCLGARIGKKNRQGRRRYG